MNPSDWSQGDAPLQEEFDFYVANQSTLVDKYEGRVIVIQGKEIIGDFDDMLAAYHWVEQNDLLGTVMMQKVGPGKENYTFTIACEMFA